MMLKMIFSLLYILSFALSQDTLRPEPIDKPVPDYPEYARTLRLEAQIFLNVLINTRGIVVETDLLYATFVYPGDRAAIESKNELIKVKATHRNSAGKLLELTHRTAKLWKFKPASVHGKPIEAVIVVPFTFNLTRTPRPAVDPRFQLKK